MALIAMTTADSVDYVSDLDPSKTRVKTDKLVDPTDVSKGYVHDTVIKPGATTFKLRGLDARAAQHELDHLDGVLIMDYSVRQ